MRSFDSLQRAYDATLPPDDDPVRCSECNRDVHYDNAKDCDERWICLECYENMDKCGHCGDLEHGECRDYDDEGD